MAQKSSIEWTDATWNPVRGCTRVSEGCRHCYAEKVAARFSGPGQAYEGLAKMLDGGEARWTGVLRLVEKALSQPLRWRAPRRIFVNSMSDLFHENLSDADIDKVFAVMALAHQHTMQVLTKRAKRARRYLSDPTTPRRIARICIDMMLAGQVKPDAEWPVVSIGDIDMPDDVTMKAWPLANVWIGVSVEDQETADERVPHLLDTPAVVRFLSCEPLLGPLDLNRIHETFDDGRAHSWESCLNGRRFDPWSDGMRSGYPKIDWVIVGGESGRGFVRALHPKWVRDIRDQCVTAGTAFFFKQWGEYRPCAPDEVTTPRSGWTPYLGKAGRLMAREELYEQNGAAHVERLGKALAGRMLDGQTWDQFPKVGQ